MAQTIKLKRSATQGKVPNTGNLALGEIAVNTYDGRLFFKKNDGSDSIEHIVTTDSVTTGSITISGTTQTTTLTTTNRIDKQYLDDEVLNTSLNTFTGSAITITGNGTSGSVAVFNDTHEVTNAAINSLDSGTTITHDNDTNIIFTVSGSNGELLTITDSNSGNLLEVNDSSGIDVFTVSATGDVSASGAITASGVTGLTSLSVGGTTTTNNLTISSLSNQGSEATALMINGSNVVGTRELGDNAFNSTAFTTNTGTVTSVGTNTGLSGTVTTSGNLSLALGDLADMTQAWVTGEDEFIVLDNGTQKRKLSSEIFGSNAFNSTAFATGDNFDADGTFASLRAQGTTAGDVGLGNVTNESKSTMFTNAALTGTPTAPTADAADDTTQIATTAFVKSQNYITSADGGNAQTLDSIDSSGFIRANANDDVSAHTEWQDSKEIRLGTSNDAQLYHNGTNTFFTNGTGNLIIRNNTNDGNVVLQSDDGSGGVDSYLYLDGTNGKVQIEKPTDISDTTQSDAKTTGAFVVDGGVGIAKTLNVGEDVVAFASSDERYKDNVTPIENPNEKLKQIGGYTFDWNDNHEVFKGQHDVGVIAQEIEKVLPEIVETRESGYKAVKYEKIVALLIESNKELLKRIEDLESKIK